MGYFSELDAEQYSANETYHGYVGHIGKPMFEEIHILTSYCEAKDKIENLFAYTSYDAALEAKADAERCNKEASAYQYPREYFIETIQVKD